MTPCENVAIRFVEEANDFLNTGLGLQTNLSRREPYIIRYHIALLQGLIAP